jgi:hypothetical protein
MHGIQVSFFIQVWYDSRKQQGHEKVECVLYRPRVVYIDCQLKTTEHKSNGLNFVFQLAAHTNLHDSYREATKKEYIII